MPPSTFARSRSVLRGLLAREQQLLLYGFSDVLGRGTETLRSVLFEILEEGAAVDEFRADLPTEHMADFLTEVCEAFANRLISVGASSRDAELIETVVEISLRGVTTR